MQIKLKILNYFNSSATGCVNIMNFVDAFPSEIWISSLPSSIGDLRFLEVNPLWK